MPPRTPAGSAMTSSTATAGPEAEKAGEGA